MPWCNGSRKKLLLIWLPLQLLAIAGVTLMAYPTFSIPKDIVSKYSMQLLYHGYLTQEYFIFIVAKDLFIMIT